MNNWNQRRSTRLAKQKQDRQLAVTDSTTDLVATIDIDGFLITLNSAGFKLLGLDKEREHDISLLRLASFYSETSAKNLLGKEIPKAIKDNASLSETTLLTTQGKEVPSSQVLMAHKDEHDNVKSFSIILRDISEIKAAEEERKELLQQLHQAKKMETIGRLAGGIAHDFNNILTVIIGYSELGMINKASDHPDRDTYEKILNSSQKAARLSNQLLDFSSKQMIEPQVLNLNAVIMDSNHLLERLIGEEISITTKLDPTLWPIKIDRSQLEQVILNLAVNARDAIDSNGCFSLLTRNICLSEIEAKKLNEITGKEYVELNVTDNGPGISKDIIDYIFEPFYTTKQSGKGTGLGLSAVYGAIKQNNGHITVKSDSINGTSFHIYLPRIVETATLLPSDGHIKREEFTGNLEKVLLVEDDDEVRQLLAQTLTNLNYRVYEAVNSIQALDVFKEDINHFDIVISDIVMPKMDGLDLCEKLQALKADVKIMLISGHTERVSSLQKLNQNKVKLLVKPFSSNKIAQEIKRMLIEDES